MLDVWETAQYNSPQLLEAPSSLREPKFNNEWTSLVVYRILAGGMQKLDPVGVCMSHPTVIGVSLGDDLIADKFLDCLQVEVKVGHENCLGSGVW